MLLYASTLKMLTLAGEALRSLMHPIAYLHVYVPVLPAMLMELLDAPTPFLMGACMGGHGRAALAAHLSSGRLRRLDTHSCGCGRGERMDAELESDVASMTECMASMEGLVVADLDRCDWWLLLPCSKQHPECTAATFNCATCFQIVNGQHGLMPQGPKM